MTPTTRDSGWAPFLLAFGPMLVGLVLMNVLERLTPDFAYLAIPSAIAFGTPQIMVFARKFSLRAQSGIIAMMMLYYGWLERIEGEYGAWQFALFVLLLSTLFSLGFRFLPWWSWVVSTFFSLGVAMQVYVRLPKPYIFPLGFSILIGLLALRSRQAQTTVAKE